MYLLQNSFKDFEDKIINFNEKILTQLQSLNAHMLTHNRILLAHTECTKWAFGHQNALMASTYMHMHVISTCYASV